MTAPAIPALLHIEDDTPIEYKLGHIGFAASANGEVVGMISGSELVRALDAWNTAGFQRALKEGPNPDGVFNRLRRERDTARAERDRLEAEVAFLREQRTDAYKQMWEVAVAFGVAQHKDGFGLVPLTLMHKVHASVFECVGGYDPILPEEPSDHISTKSAENP